jgi:translation initiation factor 2B subunit (eIF-2B alpha/beta/delta family)
MELVGQANSKEILGNHYNHSQERINAEIQNSIALTKNFKIRFNLDDKDSADLYRLARGGAKRIKRYYSNLYKNSKQLIEDEIGDMNVVVSSATSKRLNELVATAKNPTNVENKFIEDLLKINLIKIIRTF